MCLCCSWLSGTLAFLQLLLFILAKRGGGTCKDTPTLKSYVTLKSYGLLDKLVVAASGGLRGGGDNGEEGLCGKFVVAASGGLRGGGDNGEEGLPGALRAVWGSCRRQQPKTTQVVDFSRVHM
ncbi:hypothetical protein LR48_Vigan11g009700 [Vigna angularis]|uniref:Secreted protein n=1 Tax=Phaseolus angularis TaxID=3914 RepID=A0A0L9VPT5_PHAAN|nr:hypothetical protein LR48_Vigan11g009700 [Vigna angularis]